MRLYLDTNVLAAFLLKRGDDIDHDTIALLTDESSLLYTSPVCVNELIHLIKTGRIITGRDWGKGISVVQKLEESNIFIAPLTPAHLEEVERLPAVERHNDPADRLIIAQAISDKAMLVSSDLKFPHYRKHGLNLHQNRR